MAFPPIYNSETRQVEELPEDKINDAIANGTHSFAKGQVINVIGPDGTVGNAPSENLPGLIQQGYKIETPTMQAFNESVEAETGLAGQAKSLIRNFADTATFGISGALLDRTDDDPFGPARRAAIDEKNDTAATVGKVLGIAGAPSTAVGKVMFKGAAKVGSMAEVALADTLAKTGVNASKSIAAKVLARTAEKATKYGAEGIVLSAPEVLNQAIDDPEAAAETLLAGGAIGAAFGVGSKVAQGAVKVGAQAGQAALNAASKLPIADTLENLKINQASHALGATKAVLKEPTPGKYQPSRMGQDRVNEVAKHNIENDLIIPGESGIKNKERIEKLGDQVGEKVRNAESQLDKLGMPGVQVGSLQNELLTQLDGLDIKGAPAFKTQLDNLYQMSDDLEAHSTSGVATFDQIRKFKKDLVISMKANPGSPVFKRAVGIVSEAINNAQDQAAQLFTTQVKQAGGVSALLKKLKITLSIPEQKKLADDILNYGKNKDEWGKLIDTSRLLEEKVAQQGGNKLIGPSTMTGTLLGAISGGGGPAGIALGAAAGAANVARMRYGDQALAVGIHKLQKAMGTQGAQIQALANSLKTGKAFIASKMPSATSSIYAVQTLLGDDAPKKRLDALDMLRDKTATLVGDPEALTSVISDQLGDLPERMPEVADAFAAQYTRALTYLHEQIPKPPNAPSLFDSKAKWQPSDREVAAFERKAQIVLDPMSIIKELSDNTLTKEHVMALQAVYPKLYESMQKKAYEALSDGTPNNVPYSRRLKLSLFMGSAIEPSLNANRVKTMQQNFIPDKKAEQPRANSKITIGQSTQTDYNRAENG